MLNIQDNHDGYHTFRELYEHRIALFLALVNSNPNMFKKTFVHADGNKAYDKWFLVYGTLGWVGQISYHIPVSFWDSFKCESIEKAESYDGHTSHDVSARIVSYFSRPELKYTAYSAIQAEKLKMERL
jgi:hypothetical protein